MRGIAAPAGCTRPGAWPGRDLKVPSVKKHAFGLCRRNHCTPNFPTFPRESSRLDLATAVPHVARRAACRASERGELASGQRVTTVDPAVRIDANQTWNTILRVLEEQDKASDWSAVAGSSSSSSPLDLDLLARVFGGFSHLPCSSSQSERDIRSMHQLFKRFVITQGSGSLWPSLSAAGSQALLDAVKVLEAAAWFPTYGCALLEMAVKGSRTPHPGLPSAGSGVHAPCEASGEVDMRVQLEEVDVFLLGLDDWRFKIHSTKQGLQHSAVCRGHTLLHCGTTPDFPAFLQQLHEALRQLQERSAAAAAAAGGGRGGQAKHQHTPAYLHALVGQILEQMASASSSSSGSLDGQDGVEPAAVLMRPPRGGFTDVGRHTGSEPRDTCWPLVQQTLQAALKQCGAGACQYPGLLFKEALAHFELWLLARQVKALMAAPAQRCTPVLLSACMQMLRSASTKAALLAEDDGLDVSVFEAACHAIEQQLQDAAALQALAAGKALHLDREIVDSDGAGEFSLPSGVIPAAVEADRQATGLDAARQRAAQNLRSRQLPAYGINPYATIRAALGAADPQDDMEAQLRLREVERELFVRVTLGIDASASTLDDQQMSELQAVVDAYRELLRKFMQTDACEACMMAELRSRELLVVWAAYCLMHAAARRRHPDIMRGYGVALCWDDLRHLLLSDRAAVDAALGVAAYLHQYQVPGKELFSLRDGGEATFAMALAFAEASKEMEGIWAAEQRAATLRREGHWQAIRKQQQEAARLRKQLLAKRATEATLRAYFRQNFHYDSWHYEQNGLYASQRRQLSKKRAELGATLSDISRLEAQLQAAESPPDAVIQPLPMARHLALPWIFFLHMPATFRHLSCSSFLAQQMLLPCPSTHKTEWQQQAKLILTHQYPTSLVEQDNSHQHSQYAKVTQRNGSDDRVMLVADAIPPFQPPSHIDRYHSPDCGVWHPDDVQPHLGWKGSGSACDQALGFSPQGFPSQGFFFNPFAAIPDRTVELLFTEALPHGCGLDWAMHTARDVAATPSDRGNWAVARQDQRPAWVSKPGFLALGVMRAQGVGQLRRLCDALHQRRADPLHLPLSRPEVVTLVRQAVYQLGTLTAAAGKPALLWRTDWGGRGDMLPTLCAALAALAEQLDQTPRQHDGILLLGEVAAYLATWHAPCGVPARRFACMSGRVADELEEQVRAEAERDTGAAQQQLQAKQCKLRMLSLLCFGTLALETEDAAQLLQLLVQVQAGHVFMEHVDEEQQQALRRLHVRCRNVAARQAPELVRLTAAQPDMLTAAVARVLQRTPPNLTWERLGRTGSFESVGPDGHLYSINVLDGTVLLDGLPPGRLPHPILRHPLYQRTFGRRNFEVAFTAAGVLQTLKQVGGRYYDFRMCSDGQLVIQEIDTQQAGVCLELLDVGPDEQCKPWGDTLPVRLRQLYSHWYCRERGIMVLRPPHFQLHTSHFLIQACPEAAGSPALQYRCWSIPLHLQSQPWTQLLQSHAAEISDMLVLPSQQSLVKHVLSKLEVPAFIHTYIVRGSGQAESLTGVRPLHGSQVLWELPRFSTGLRFLQQGGRLVSQDFGGYMLAEEQQLCEQEAAQQLGHEASSRPRGRTLHTLSHFRQYLLLQRMPGSSSHNSSCARRPDRLVLVPVGRVGLVESAAVQRSGRVYVHLPQGCGHRVEFHTYQVHPRFGDLRTSSKLARLQLAALYAGTSSLLPEPRSRATGAQTALQLLRQCWGNRPLSQEEQQQLSDVVGLGGHLASALHVVAAELLASSVQLSHLHSGAGSCGGGAVDSDAASCYLHPEGSSIEGEFQGWCYNPRMLLTPEEELRKLGGMRRSRPEPPPWFRSGQCRALDVRDCPVDALAVPEVERQICACVQQEAAQGTPQAPLPPYPLQAKGGAVQLEVEMHEELRSSWEAWHHTPEPTLKLSYPDLTAKIQNWQSQVTKQRACAEAYVLSSLALVPPDTPHGTSFRMLRAAGAAPLPSLLDLARVAASPSPDAALRQFNPFLSDAACGRLLHGISTWLQLCVLEDRLGRLDYLVHEPREHMEPTLVKELLVKRTWSPQHHPDWLVFEVEGQLQVRPNQYSVAQQLLDKPGAIAQLNMGEGKTRVIMPLLALYWTRQRTIQEGQREVVRLNLLSPLLEEAYQHLHTHLCASVQGRRIFTLPFHRDVSLTVGRVKAMTACIRFCQQVGGLLLVAPEHRLSLQLKWHELRAGGSAPEVCTALEELAALPYCDLLDESDELLHHRLQLVYAWGVPSELPSLAERAPVLQAMLRQVSAYADQGPETAAGKLFSGVAVWTPKADRAPGGFSGLRLLPGKALEDAKPLILQHLAEAMMISSSRYELQWMQLKPTIRDRLLQCMLTSGQDVQQLLGDHDLEEDKVDQLLTLRGLLSCGLLTHCLQKRARVDFGVNRAPTARKSLAVPFRAADVPAERSEFSHPDIALLLTMLAYYHDGLSRQELLSALQKLLAMGLSAQRDHYNEWFGLSKDRIPQGELSKLDDVSKLDPSNMVQQELLHKYFSHNMALVDFWLNHCIFPIQTKQYPQRLTANSWNLADNARGRVVGFSGTNDNHRLLPLQVQQAEMEEASLKGTNGKMLDIMLKDTKGYYTIAMSKGQAGVQPVWLSCLDLALSLKLDALLDCGALLAGVSNREASRYLIERLDRSRYQGVCYFDAEEQAWMVREAQGRCLPRDSSPVAESRAFVVYDDARCRGADLQLRPDAVGLLTLGPSTCKDKLMQAAGRLRLLGRGQELWLAGTEDVTRRVREYAGSDSTEVPGAWEVLRWVMHNTVQATLHGTLEWARQGSFFAATKGRPDHVLQDELLQLHELYGPRRELQGVGAAVQGLAARQLARGPLSEGMPALLDRICQLAGQHGQGHEVVLARSGDEECEREVEQEQEEEQEAEVQVARMEPAQEVDWAYGSVLDAGSLQALPQEAGVQPLQGLVAQLLLPAGDKALAAMQWSERVHCTSNFAGTVRSRGAQRDYLRPVSSLLLFPDGQVLMVSEREADALLELLWRGQGQGQGGGGNSTLPQAPVLLTLSYAADAPPGSSSPWALSRRLSSTSWALQGMYHGSRLCEPELVSLQLFDGQASFHTPELRREVRRLVCGKRKAVEELTSWRGKQSLLPRSDLERACEGIVQQ